MYHFIILGAIVVILYCLTTLFLLFQNKLNNKFIQFLLKTESYNLLISKDHPPKVYTKVKALLLTQLISYIVFFIVLIATFTMPSINYALMILLFMIIEYTCRNLIINHLKN